MRVGPYGNRVYTILRIYGELAPILKYDIAVGYKSTVYFFADHKPGGSVQLRVTMFLAA